MLDCGWWAVYHRIGRASNPMAVVIRSLVIARSFKKFISFINVPFISFIIFTKLVTVYRCFEARYCSQNYRFALLDVRFILLAMPHLHQSRRHVLKLWRDFNYHSSNGLRQWGNLELHFEIHRDFAKYQCLPVADRFPFYIVIALYVVMSISLAFTSLLQLSVLTPDDGKCYHMQVPILD